MYDILAYTDEYQDKWDKFVMNDCINGTFLQTRRFLSYHSKDKFKDCSLMIFDENQNIAAVFPACETMENGKKVFNSHLGSTFGGPCINKKFYNSNKLILLLQCFNDYIVNIGFEKVYLKITPNIFSRQDSELLQYFLKYYGYDEYTELSTYVDIKECSQDIISDFSQNKRRNYNKCVKNGLTFKKLDSDSDIAVFFDILSANLIKFEAKPVHSLNELLEFKNNIFPDSCSFYGVFLEDKIIAGCMNFYFIQSKSLHTQYLCSCEDYNDISPMTFLYFSMIDIAKKANLNCLSWGISTENKGKDINLGLTKNKESYNSKYSLNRTFYKEF